MELRKYLGIIVLLLLIIPITGFAETVIRSGESVSISNDKGVVGDFYGFGNVVSMSGIIEGDFITVAGRMTLNGEVTDDVLAAGASVDVHGPVGDDVRVIGGEVVIADVVAGDVIVLGGTVNILSTATIGGDVIIYGGSVEIAGTVGGTVLGNTSQLRLDSEVGGDVQVQTGQLILGDNASVAGSVTYESKSILQRSPNAIVTGELLRNDSVTGQGNSERPYRTEIMMALVLAFAALVWFLLSRKTLHTIVVSAAEYSLRPALFGLGVLLIAPILMVVLFTSMVGTLVGVAVLSAYIFTLLLALTAAPATIGILLLQVFNQPVKKLSAPNVLFGVVMFSLLLLIPVLGIYVAAAVVLLTFGAIVERVYNTFK